MSKPDVSFTDDFAARVRRTRIGAPLVLLVVVCGLLGVVAATGSADASGSPPEQASCRPGRPSLTTALRVAHRQRLEVTSTTTITLPYVDERLLLSPSEPVYRAAMGCLLGAQQADLTHPVPVVRVDRGSTTVTDVVTQAIPDEVSPGALVHVGFWQVRRDPPHFVQGRFHQTTDLTFDPASVRQFGADDVGVPEGLRNARWRSVTLRTNLPLSDLRPAPAIVSARRVPAATGDAGTPEPIDAGTPMRTVVWRLAGTGPPQAMAVKVGTSFSRDAIAAAGITLMENSRAAAIIPVLADALPYLVPAVISVLVLRRGRRPEGGAVRQSWWAAWHVLAAVALVVAADVLAQSLRFERESYVPFLALGSALGVAWLIVMYTSLRRAVGISTWRHPWVRFAFSGLLLWGLVLAAASAVQFDRALLTAYERLDWLFPRPEQDWREIYPQALSSQLAYSPLWILVVLAVVRLLYHLCREADTVTPTVRGLLGFVFVAGTVPWPDLYLSVPVPLDALVTFMLLILFLRWGRAQSVLCRLHAGDSGHQWRIDRGVLVTIAGRYQTISTAAAQADQQWMKRDATTDTATVSDQVGKLLNRQGQTRQKLRELRQGAGLTAEDPDDITPVHVTLAFGPGRRWWDNGFQSAVVATIVGAPFAVYLVWSGYRSTWRSVVDDPFGLLHLTTDVAETVLLFTLTAFVMGCLWRELPFKWGVFKALPLVAAYIVGAVVDTGLRGLTNETAREHVVALGLALLIVLTVTGFVLDVRALQPAGQPWTRWTALIVGGYRLAGAGTSAAFVIAQIAALIGLWNAVKNGITFTHPTPPGT